MEEQTNNTIIENPIGVYVKTNEDGYVIEVNSDIFIKDFTGWQKIDVGYGDKFAHAQSNYFDGAVRNDKGENLIKIKK